METVVNEISDADVATLRKIKAGEPVDAADFAWLEQCGVVSGTPIRPRVTTVGDAFLS
jgi:hypothetical protein